MNKIIAQVKSSLSGLSEPEFLRMERKNAKFFQNGIVDLKLNYGLGASLPVAGVKLPVDQDPGSGWDVADGITQRLVNSGDADLFGRFAGMDDERSSPVASWQAAKGKITVLPDFKGSAEITLSKGAGRVVVDVERDSEATLVVHYDLCGESMAGLVDINLSEGSRVKVFVYAIGKGDLFAAERAVIGERARLEVHRIVGGGGLRQTRLQANLMGDGARVEYLAAGIGDGGLLFDDLSAVRHLVGNTKADLNSAVVLRRGDKCVSRGRLLLEPGVSGAASHQRSEALLLEAGAEFTAMPDLIAKHNLVQASHGAAVGGPNKEQLFYLMSRGLSRAEATDLLVGSFLSKSLRGFADAGLEMPFTSSIMSR